MVTDLVLLQLDAEIVAAHAGDAVGDVQVLPRGVADDLGRALVEARAVGLVEVVALEAVREREDGLAAVVVEVGVGASWSERELEQALVGTVAAEIVRGPEVARRDLVTLDQAIVLRHARLLEAGTLGQELLDVARNTRADL